MPSRTLSQQLADDLREQITSGELKVGESIPSQSQLTARYDVSTSVTRKAVDQLRNEGLLAGQPGKAVYVQATPAERLNEANSQEQLSGRLETLEAQVRSLSERAGVPPDLTAVEEVRQEVSQLRREVATLRAHLIDLYGRVGQSYPHDAPAANAASVHRAAGGAQ